MSFFDFLVLICMAGLIFFCLAQPIWWSFDHWGWSSIPDTILDNNAQVKSFTSEKVKYTKNNAKFKTTVTFSDGFYFITHKTKREQHFMSYTISLSPELKVEILKKAIAKHTAAVNKVNKKAKSL